MPSDEKTGTVPRDYFYRQLGYYLTGHCHLLLALWDGDERNILLGGTADVLQMALHGHSGKQRNRLNKENSIPVLQIITPKKGADVPEKLLAFRFLQSGMDLF